MDEWFQADPHRLPTVVGPLGTAVPTRASLTQQSLAVEVQQVVQWGAEP